MFNEMQKEPQKVLSVQKFICRCKSKVDFPEVFDSKSIMTTFIKIYDFSRPSRADVQPTDDRLGQ